MLDEPRPYLSVARALTYYEGSEKRYLISTPWEQGLPGRLTVCTREEIVDGNGNNRTFVARLVVITIGARS
jgi:hypothetical protein